MSVGLAKDLQYPLYPNNKVTHRKSKKLQTRGSEWNNAAIEVKKGRKEGKENSYPFIHPAPGLHQFPSPSQPKGKNENKGENGVHAERKKENKKNQE